MNTEEEMREAVEKMVFAKKDKIQEGIMTIGSNLGKGMRLDQALGMKPDDVEKLYSQAYQLYNMGKYVDANNMFAALVSLNPFEKKYLFGLAASFQMLKQYDSAGETYLKVGGFHTDDPVPFFHAAECFLEIKENISAMIALQMCIKRSGEKEEYALLKSRAEATFATLQSQQQAGGEASTE